MSDEQTTLEQRDPTTEQPHPTADEPDPSREDVERQLVDAEGGVESSLLDAPPDEAEPPT